MSRVYFRAGKTVLDLKGSEPYVNRQLVALADYLPHVDPAALDGALGPRGFAVAEGVATGGASAGSSTGSSPGSSMMRDAPDSGQSRPETSPSLATPESSGVRSIAGAGLPIHDRGAGSPRPEPDEFETFYRKHEPAGRDRQADSALLFAYYLQQRGGAQSLELRDLLRCCMRVGVDTRNFNRTLGQLTRRGLLETVRHGHAYRLSPHGVTAVEQQIS